MWYSWISRLQRSLEADPYERKNLPIDRYAIAAYKRSPGRLANSIIGHLPREISRPASFFFFFSFPF